MAPIVRGRKGEHEKVFEEIQRAGYLRVRVDGTVGEVGEFVGRRLDKNKKHTIEVVIDRLVRREA
jgi:excinuclease ABC subunit A